MEEFDWHHNGFRKSRGTEKPLLRYQAAMDDGHEAAAVLDWRGAYLSLFDFLCRRVPRNLVVLISILISENTIVTVGDKSGNEGTMGVGVLDVFPLSPSLFSFLSDQENIRNADLQSRLA